MADTTTLPTAPSAQTATDVIRQMLEPYDLGFLADWALAKYQNGETLEQIVSEARRTPEYKARYPAMEELAKQGRAMTEGAYVSYENMIRDLSEQYGVPYEMYSTPEAIAKMIVNNVSPTVANERFQMAAIGALTAPQEVKDAYRNLYGLEGGALIATYLDADKALPVLERQAAAAQVAGAAARQGMVANVTEAERLASLGIDYSAAARGYGQAAGFGALDYNAGMATTRDDRVAAAFGDTAAQRRVQQVAEARQAAFQGGGGLAAGAEGVSALGRGSP